MPALKDFAGKPWMDEREVARIRQYLQPHHRMLEYGAGGSTLHFAPLVGEYVAIEHDPQWYEQIRTQCDPKVQLNLVPANLPHSRPSTYEQFKDYIELVGLLGKTFDRVLIDGRARPQCAKAILPFLAKDGIVFFHDFWKPERMHYREVLQWYAEVESITDTKQTLAIFKKAG